MQVAIDFDVEVSKVSIKIGKWYKVNFNNGFKKLGKNKLGIIRIKPGSPSRFEGPLWGFLPGPCGYLVRFHLALVRLRIGSKSSWKK